ITDTTKTTATFKWGRPHYDGGLEITGYIVEHKKEGEDDWIKDTAGSLVRITEFVIANLQPGGKYNFRVSAVNAEGVGEPAQVQELVEVVDREETPDFELDAELRRTLVVRAGGSIRIFVPIKGRPTPDVTWTKEETPLKGRAHIDTTESYTLLVIPECMRNDAGKYVLTLENVAGKKSGFVNVRILDSPGPPINLKPREITKDSITLQWEIPIIDGGSKITNYIIEKRDSTRKAYSTIITNWQKCSFKVPNLTEGSEYYFRVTAENEYGIGEPAETSEPIRASQAPTAPESLNVTDIGKDYATIAWTKPKHDGGSRITGYVLEAQRKGAEQWSHLTAVKALDYTAKHLSENEEYVFRVMAVNSSGRSDPRESRPVLIKEQTTEPQFDLRGVYQKDSSRRDGGAFTLTASNPGGFAKYVFNVKVLDRPGPPDGPLAVTDVTSEKCILSWLPPSHDGGAKIEHYIIEKRETSRLAWTNVASDLQVNRFKVTKLLKGNEYIFRVMAVNKYGVGEPLESEPVIATNPYVVSDPPQTPEVTTVTKDSMVVCWGHPENNGGSSISNYIIERRDKTGLRWVKCNKRTVTDLRYKVSGLTPGHEYEFRIIAENAAGLSAPSPSSPFYKACDTIFQPGPPGNPRVLDTTKSSITLAWNKPVYDGGSDITGYIVETCLPEEDEWTIVTPKEGITSTSFTITNLKENQEYKINISALNCEGVGEPASVPGLPKAEDRQIPPEIELDAELRKVITIRACGTLRLFVPIRGRPTPEVKWSRENGDPLERATIESTSSFTSVQIENVSRFDSGKYMLTVENTSGSKTAFVNVKVLDTPGAPQNLKVKEVTKESVSITWDPPVIDGGSRIRNYIIEKRESTRKAYSTVTVNCHKTSWKISQLEEGRNYFFRVLAENEYGVGLPVETNESVKVSEKPLPPGKVTLQDVTSSSVTLTWERPDHDGGSRITGYIVEMQGKGSEKWTQCMTVKVNEAVVAGLTQGEEYLFRISAMNEKGISDPRQLNVPVIAKDLVIAPAFKLLFSTFSVLAGDDLKVDIPYVARPKAAVSWYKDGVPLKETTRVNAETADRHLYLVIKEACREDVGQYTIKLSNSAGEATADIGIVVLDKPGPPTGPIKIDEVTADSVTLSWQPPEYDGGCSINNYIVTGLEEGIEYEYRVYAENIVGISKASKVSEVCVARDPCDAPGTPEAVVVTRNSVTLRWTKPEYDDFTTTLSVKEAIRVDGGQYTLLLKNVGGEKSVYVHVKVLDRPGPPEGPISIYGVTSDKCCIAWKPPLQDGGSDVTRDDTGKYLLEIENGVGEPKSITVSVKVLDTPSACQRLVVKNVTLGKATLSWEPPLIDGGSEITNYIIEKRDATKKAYSSITTECSNTTYKVEGLSEEICYFFRVSAVNENGFGDPCETLQPIRATETPGPVKDLVMKDTTKSSVILQWTKPDHDGGSHITDYVIEKKSRDEKQWTEAGTSKRCLYEVTNLKEFTVIDFRVYSKNEKGQSDFSQVGPITVQDLIIPLTANLADYPGGEINVRIGQNVNIELPYTGKPKPTIQWLKDSIPLKESEQIRFRLTENKAALTIRNVRKDNAGKYTLLLDNKISKESFHIQVVTLGPPSPPVGPIRFDEIKAQSIIISWDQPTDDGGGEITCYSVEKRETSHAAWKMVCSSVVRTTFKIPNLVKGTEYQFRVRAENKYGVSEALTSQDVIAQHQYKPPGPPGRPVVYNVTSDGMTIQWDAPAYDGGSPITGYHVEKKDRNSLLWTKVNSSVISGRDYRIIGLIEGLEYQFRVYAQNNAGLSTASETSKHTLAISPVGKFE
ncbi:titin-like isoform X1, partial [Arapaima gigas]